MASLVLSVAGGAVGGLFGPAGAIVGRLAGALAGSAIDRALFGGGGEERVVEGPRLADLDVMASTEGAPIPRVYGRARLSGQVIWATELEEVVTTEAASDGGGGKGFGATSSGGTSTTTYAYFANFAVGLCEGEIGRVMRIWADGKLLDTTGLNIRVHSGSETQAADELIIAKQGAEGAPAYRGLAYILFERLPLKDFGNRIPQLSFEIVRPIGQLERMARAVTLIPGTTEFGYDPATVIGATGPGQSAPENRHVTYAVSDIEAALDDLQALCPNLERVAIVVAWFGSDLRAGQCTIRPEVDNAAKATSGGGWSVNGVSRGGAAVVSQIGGRPAFGGTPSDSSVTHLIAELKSRGLKITFYPFVMMDIAAGNALPDPWTGAASQPAYPWRGRITCDPAPGRPGSPQGTSAAATQVMQFFAGGDWNYRRMVLHYANLCAAAGGVEAFLIGSELKALTRVRSGAGVYPAVDALVTLASDVKAIVGSTLVTYGADWTEYGADVVSASEVRFPLDTLWASSAIGAVGIDWYPPLSDWRDDADHLDRDVSESIYDRDYLRGHVRGGEGFDWYYADDAARESQSRSLITDGLGKPWMFRQKDLVNWWSQPHYARVGGDELASPTAWSPRSKPIWLTEVGCPAVDKGSNQPSVFPDPKSSENFAPHFSNGMRDDLIQRRALEATLSAFDPAFGASSADNPVSPVYGGWMIDPSAMHLWTWDARPYPVFPAALDVWSDGVNWQTGHWLTGRLGSAPLDALVDTMLADSGVAGIDASALNEVCDGYVVDRPMSPRAMIEPLALTYAFDATTADGMLCFVPRGGDAVAEFDDDDLVLPKKDSPARLTRAQETELPRQVSVGFTDGGVDYRRSATTSRRLTGGARRMLHADLAVVTSAAAAHRRADIWLQDLWAGRENVSFALGRSALALAPGDVIGVTLNGRRRLFEVGEIVDAETRQVTARSIDPDVFGAPQAMPQFLPPRFPPAIGPPVVVPLDLPVIGAANPDVLTRLAISATPWPAAVMIWSSRDGASFAVAGVAGAPAIIGETLDTLPAGPTARWDRGNAFRVRLYSGALSSLGDGAVLEGGNAAAIRTPAGWEILQFANAELVGDRTFRLSRLLRGQLGTDAVMATTLPTGQTFVLLDRRLTALARGLDALDRAMQVRVVASGRSHDDPASVALTVTPGSTALRPLSPVHLRAARTIVGVQLSWIRRTRIDGDGWGIEVPLGEDDERYMLDILSGVSVVRSIVCASAATLYASADEIADFGAPQTTLRVRVVQLSAAVGAGYPADITLSL